jgi:hypothetical protein
MIYTGNNGRIYIARQLDEGIQGSFTRSVVAGQAVAQTKRFPLLMYKETAQVQVLGLLPP